MTIDADSNFEKQFAAFMGGSGDEQQESPPADDPPEDKAAEEEQKQVEAEPERKESTLADKAKALGWNPNKDEFESKTGKEWSTAGQFLRQREMADEIHRRGQETKQLRRDLDRLQKAVTEKFDNLSKSEQDARLAQLAHSIKQAAIDQDFDSLDTLIGERDKLLKVETVRDDGGNTDSDPDLPYVESADEVARVVEKWKSENKWFDRASTAIKQEAMKFEMEYRNLFESPSITDTMEYVTQKMTEKYPVFAAQKAKLKAPDTTPRQSERPGAASYSSSQLDAASRGIFNSMKNRGLFKTAADEQAFLKEALGG